MVKDIEKLELNDEVVNYYDKILNKAKDLFQNKNYEQAIKLLKEELEQPYIPFEYEKNFEDTLFQFKGEYKYITLDNELKSLSKNDMLKTIFNDKFNVFLFDYFIQTYHDKLDQDDYDKISDELKSKKLNNTQKFYILDSLAHFEINKDFIFYNDNVKNDVVLNTLTFHDHECFEKYNQTLDIIEKNLFKDPTIVKFSEDLLNAIASKFFPEFIFDSPEELAKLIIETINNSLNGIEPNWNELNNEQRIIYNMLIEIQNNELI